MKEYQSTDSNYIQQHLANERTFLAWIRTAIAIIGVGYLSVKLHFFSRIHPTKGDIFAQVIGLISIFTGLALIVYSTITFLLRKSSINQQTYRVPITAALLFSIGMLIIGILFFLYLFLM